MRNPLRFLKKKNHSLQDDWREKQLSISNALWHRYMFVSRFRLIHTHKYTERQTTKTTQSWCQIEHVQIWRLFIWEKIMRAPNLSKTEKIYIYLKRSNSKFFRKTFNFCIKKITHFFPFLSSSHYCMWQCKSPKNEETNFLHHLIILQNYNS